MKYQSPPFSSMLMLIRVHLRRSLDTRHLVLSMALACFIPSISAEAAVVVTAEGQRIGGELSMPSEDAVTITTEAGETRTFKLIDLQRVLLRPDLSPGEADLLLIDNDGFHAAETVSQAIKLKAGLHRLTIAHWQAEGGSELKLEYSGPGTARTEVPGSMLFNVKNEQDPPTSPGYDAQGRRLPENPDATRPRLRYRYFTGPRDAPWGTIAVFNHLEEKRSGTTDRVSTRIADQREDFGALFYGYLKIPKDGPYTFHLTSDDGARMWLGADPPMLRTLGAGGSPPEQRPWTINLADDGRVHGRITAWDAQTLTLEAPLDEQTLTLHIPRDRIAAVLPRGQALAATDRAGERPAADHAYVRKADEAEGLARVSGRVLGVEADTLMFEFRGEARRIALDRLAGLVFEPPTRDAGAGPGQRFAFSQRLDLLPGHVLPGQWQALSDGVVRFDTAWGQAIDVPAEQVAAVRMIGGRLIHLADTEPDDVRIVPYFDRVVPMRRNRSIPGGTLELINGPREQRGFAVHGQTHLHFSLAGGFERFLATAGLAAPDGEAGEMTFRVLGDGKPLFEHAGLTADDPPLNIDLDITGVDQLTLETGFAGGQDVGDRGVWADPRLIRK